MQDKGEGSRLARESRPPGGKPETCPKCGGKQISPCPGGSKRESVKGIWWRCEECSHEW